MNTLKGSTDLWFCTFLKMEGYEIVDYNVISNKRGKFFFDISDEDWKALKIKCDKSIITKVKTAQISLKDLLF